MSIEFNKKKCVGCGLCAEVCPGSLIEMDKKGFAKMSYPKDCWGCAACVKECSHGAIKYFLGEDIGGKGTYLYTRDKKDKVDFVFVRNFIEKVITINRKDANQY